MSKPVDLTAYRNRRQREGYDTALAESSDAIDAIEPPPVHALHKTIGRIKQKTYAEQLRLDTTPKPYRDSNGLTDDDWYTCVQAGSIDPSTSHSPKPKKKRRKANPHKQAMDKIMREMVLKEFKAGNFTRKKHWTEENGWYWIFTSTPEFLQGLDL